MAFCLTYYSNNPTYYLEDVDELKVKYNPKDIETEKFGELLDKFQNKIIILDINKDFSEIDGKLLKYYNDKYNNLKVMFDFNNKECLEKVQKYKLPFFFSNYVTSFDQLDGYIKYNPTDMYICEELGFSLERISNVLHENNIKVRVFPNICQSSFIETESIKTFFIRPEDIDIYNQYVDVFELITDASRQAVIYKIYKQKKWIGNINEIIPSFKEPISNAYILNNFGKIRIKCNKRCNYTSPKKCNLCNEFIKIAEIMAEKDREFYGNQRDKS